LKKLTVNCLGRNWGANEVKFEYASKWMERYPELYSVEYPGGVIL
jgi:hypothetical protein